MNIPITTNSNWTPTPGLYLGQVIEAGEYQKQGSQRQWVRIVFALQDQDGQPYRVQKCYTPDISPGSQLALDIEILAGPDALKGQQSFDSTTLEGKEALVNVIHIHTASYDTPYGTWDRLYPPDTKISDVLRDEPGVRIITPDEYAKVQQLLASNAVRK